MKNSFTITTKFDVKDAVKFNHNGGISLGFINEIDLRISIDSKLIIRYLISFAQNLKLWIEESEIISKENISDESSKQRLFIQIDISRTYLGMNGNEIITYFKSKGFNYLEDISEEALKDYNQELELQVVEHQRLSAMNSNQMEIEVAPKIDNAVDDEDLNLILEKYSKYNTFDISLRSKLVQKRTKINSKLLD